MRFVTYEQLASSIENFALYSKDITPDSYFGFPLQPVLEAEEKLREVKMPRGQKRVHVNQVAAQVILESYLESRRTPG